jgi:hypothetical protein
VQAFTKYKLASLRASRRCPLLAQSGHALMHCTCLLSGVKRTCPFALHMSAFDPKRTSALFLSKRKGCYDLLCLGGRQ